MAKTVSVRPAFLGASVVVLLLLIPSAAYVAWDYVEVHRLRARATEISARGEPISEEEATRSETPTKPVSGAYRLYEAAAALMDRSTGEADATAALQLVDRASTLPFDGFPRGVARGNYFAGNVMMLQRAAGKRTMDALNAANHVAALESLYVEIRLQTVVDQRAGEIGTLTLFPVLDHLDRVLSQHRADGSELARIGAALDVFDRDDSLRRRLLVRRAAALDLLHTPTRPTHTAYWAMTTSATGPLDLHQRIRLIDSYAPLIAAAAQPWPARLDAFGPEAALSVQRQALGLAAVRCATAVVAVERYRRDHGEQLPRRIDDLTPTYLSASPIDPFSGSPLKFVPRATGFAVYSVGVNRRDDGGSLPMAFPANIGAAENAADLGIGVD